MLAPQILRRRKLLANNVGGGLVPSLHIDFSAFQNAPDIFTFTRATTATVTGYAADAVSGASQIIIPVASSEMRIQGARRVSEGVYSNVLADGTPITGTIGYLDEGARTDSALYNRDLTQADWSKTDCTAAKDAVGQDGTANGCSTLTATGANATCLQTVVAASANKTFQPSVKRKTGTGTIEITVNGGTNWQDITAQLDTVEWYEAAEARTVTNPQFGFRITTSGDEIIVDYAGCQNGAIRSSSIATTTAAVARNADVLSCPYAGILNINQGSAFAEVVVNGTSLTSQIIIGLRASQDALLYRTSGGNVAMYDGTGTVADGALANAASRKIASSWGGGTMSVVAQGSSVTSGSFDGAFNPTALYIGTTANGVDELYGVIKTIRIYRQKLSDAQLASMVA